MRKNTNIKTLLLTLFIISCGQNKPIASEPAPRQAEDVRPILIGKKLPPLTLRTPDNRLFDLNAAIARKPTVLIFYRGGWCPYCSMHLRHLQTIEADLIHLGCQIIAVSPDRPGLLKAVADKYQLNYRLLSDSDMTAAKAMGIAFQVDDALVKKYKTEYQIDIEADSGHTHHMLPVPAAFLVGTDGIIHFSYVNPTYKVRVDSRVLLEAARALPKNSSTTQ